MSREIDKPVRVGVGVIVWNPQNQVLLSKRISDKHGHGEYSFPGGKPDGGEDPGQTALRELYEETGLVGYGLDDPNIWTYDRFEEAGMHYVTLYFQCWTGNQEPRNCEPDKHGPWEWYDVDDLPEPLFCGVREAVDLAR